MYNLAALEAALAGTIFAGNLHFSPITGSTNTDALAARAQRCAARLRLSCRRADSRPRTRRSRLGLTPGQGLYVSVLLRLALPSAACPLLPLAAGLAAADAIHTASGSQSICAGPTIC